jgi:MerR family transcriptional regulator, heat shock protein HspR
MKGELIAITTFCNVHNVPPDFISTLENDGLITVTMQEDGTYIDEEQLHQLEVYTQWHELGINAEGMDALTHLIQKLRDMQAELNMLRNRLRWYEEGSSGTEI